jgi:hypothetical protein
MITPDWILQELDEKIITAESELDIAKVELKTLELHLAQLKTKRKCDHKWEQQPWLELTQAKCLKCNHKVWF